MNWEIHNLYLSQVIQVTVNQVVHRIPDALCLGAALLGAGPGKRDVKRGGGQTAAFTSQLARRAQKKDCSEMMGDYGAL